MLQWKEPNGDAPGVAAAASSEVANAEMSGTGQMVREAYSIVMLPCLQSEYAGRKAQDAAPAMRQDFVGTRRVIAEPSILVQLSCEMVRVPSLRLPPCMTVVTLFQVTKTAATEAWAPARVHVHRCR